MVLEPGEARRARTVDEVERGTQIRMAAIASVVGTSIEWYDYFLFGTAAAVVFPEVFFPDSTHYAGTLRRSRRTPSGSPPGRSAPRSSGTGVTGSAARPRSSSRCC